MLRPRGARAKLIAAATATVVLTGFAVSLTACGGGSSDADIQPRITSALRAVEPDLDRLASAVQAADAGEVASLVEVQAAAQRASQALGDARRDLRDIADDSDVSAERARELREQINGVRDLQELADALAASKLSSPRIQAATARARLALDDLGSALDVTPIAGDALAEDLRRTRNRDARRRAQRRAQRDAGDARTGQPSAPVGPSDAAPATDVSYTTYTGPAFRARVPTGSGWGTPSASEPTPGRLFRTNIRGPGGLFVIIDFTPFEAATFGGSFSTRTVVGQTAFGQAVRYVFQGGRLPECQRSTCYDYIINDRSSGRGFAVLAGGGSAAADIARTVAESVTPVE